MQAADPVHGGSVTFVHRFSGSLSLHPHFHVVAVDGVFVRDAVRGPVRFVAAPAPSPEVLADVVERIARRITRWLRRHGYAKHVPEEDRSNEAAEDDPLTACLRIASAQGTFATLLDPPRGADPLPLRASTPRASRWVAVHEGFNLHAGVTVAAGQRTDLERLFRYGARPALALDRLERLPDGRFSYRMKYPVRGHTHRILTPLELLARLASIIPPPRYPLVRYAGVFAPNSSWRRSVVPPHPVARRCCAAHAEERASGPGARTAAAQSTPLEREDVASAPGAHGTETTAGEGAARTPHIDLTAVPSAPATRIDWAQLLRHGFEIDALACPRCSGRMRVIAAVTDRVQVERVLAHVGERTGRSVPSRAWDPVPEGDAGSWE